MKLYRRAILTFILVVCLAWPAAVVEASPDLPATDLPVGPGCVDTTISEAMLHAAPGDRLLIDKTQTFNENITIFKDVTLQGGYSGCSTPSGDRSTISAKNPGAVITINPGHTVTLNNLNVTQGSGASGGGIQFQANPTTGSLTMNNVAIFGNTAADGGGVWLGKGTQLTATNVSIHDNTATGSGGGIYAESSTVTLNNSSVSLNTASTLGGGIRMVGGQLALQANSVLDHNQATTLQGGGIAATGAANVNVNSATLSFNSAGTDGGGVYLDSGVLDLRSWWNINNNSAAGSGGGVAVDGTGLARFFATAVKDSQLASNHAGVNGGGLNTTNNSTVQIYAINTFAIAITNNSAAGNGGAFNASAAPEFDVWGKIQATGNIAVGDGGVWYLGNGAWLWMTSYDTATRSDRPQIQSNQARNGGAVYVVNSQYLNWEQVDFGSSTAGNTATSGSGGAVYADSSIITAKNCTFAGNAASAGSGGAIYMNNGSVTANNCIFNANKASQNGGGIAIAGSDQAPSTLTIGVIYPDIVTTGQPSNGPGLGQVTPVGACQPVRNECSSFHDNIADADHSGDGNGGAIHATNTNSIVQFSYFHDNQAVTGAATFTSGNSTQLLNSLMHHNTATGASGAVVRGESGTLKVYQVTIADNTGTGASAGPAASSSVINSISWGNSAGGYDGIGVHTCSIGTTGGVNLDPKFVGFGDYHLRRESPAIDACASGLGMDLDNHVRPFNTEYDMGPYENDNAYWFAPVIRRG